MEYYALPSTENQMILICSYLNAQIEKYFFKPRKTQKKLPPVVTFNKTQPNIKNVIDKHWWYIPSIHVKLKKAFDKNPFIGY